MTLPSHSVVSLLTLLILFSSSAESLQASEPSADPAPDPTPVPSSVSGGQQGSDTSLSPSTPEVSLTLTTGATLTLKLDGGRHAAVLLIQEISVDLDSIGLSDGQHELVALSDEIWARGQHLMPVPMNFQGDVSVSASKMDQTEGTIKVTLMEIPGTDSDQVLQTLTQAAGKNSDEQERAPAIRSAKTSLQGPAPGMAALLETYEFLALSDAKDRTGARDLAVLNAESWRKLGDVHHEVFARAKAARFQMYTGITPSIEAELIEALERLTHSPDPGLEFATRNYLCLYYIASGQLDRALSCGQSNIASANASGNPTYRRNAINNIGGVYLRMGRSGEALQSLRQGLAIALEAELTGPLANSYNNVGLILRQRGELEEALRQYNLGLREARLANDENMIATLLGNIGRAYFAIQDYEKSLDFLNQAAVIEERYGDLADQALIKSHIGQTQLAMGDLDAALINLEAATVLSSESGHSRVHAVTLVNLGQAQFSAGRLSESRASFEQALSLQTERGDLGGQTTIHLALGQTLLEQSQVDQALVEFRTGFDLATHLADPQLTIEAAVGITEALIAQDHIALARETAMANLERVKDLREELALPEHRAALTGATLRAFEMALQLELRQDDPKTFWKALEIAEQARSQALVSRLRIQASANDERSEELKELRTEIGSRLDRRISLASSGSDPAMLVEFDQLTSEYLHQLEVLEAGLFDAQPTAQASSQTLDPSVFDRLDENTLWVYFFVAEDATYRWSYTRATGLQVRRLPGHEAISPLITQLHQSWSSGRPDLAESGSEAAASLSNLLLLDLPQTKTATRFIVNPHGPLQIIPFAALPMPDGLQRIGEQMTVISQPNMQSLINGQTHSSPDTADFSALVFADPVFSTSDPRVSNGKRQADTETQDWAFVRLGASIRELQSIRQALNPVNVQSFIGFAANRDAFLSQTGQADVLHLATHGMADDRRPESSGLMLSRVDSSGNTIPGFVGVGDIYSLRLKSSLVVLTACETALGSEQPGEGIASVSQAFLHAGADQVIATLWRVADPAAARFSELFYRTLSMPGKNPEQALQATQLQMQKERKWRSPNHWAAFVLRANAI